MSAPSAEVVVVDADLADLVPGYLENRYRDLVLLEAAVASGDWAGVRCIAHALKGSGGMYGFHPLGALGRALEASCAGDRAVAPALVEEMAWYLANVTWRAG